MSEAASLKRKAALIAWFERRWYGGVEPEWWLKSASAVYAAHVKRKRAQFLAGIAVAKSNLPVIVVGNLTVGGVGKTPLVLALVQGLKELGRKPGIISRGYGGKAQRAVLVTPKSDPAWVGDEPLLMARRSGVPVAVAPYRIEAAQLLETGGEVDLLIADDGLQHYGLARDVEILVSDGLRRFGNGRLLPAGPLREPVDRGRAVDFRVVNGGFPEPGEIRVHLELGEPVTLDGRLTQPLEQFRGGKVHAVAGIGHPDRFFKSLREAGLDVVAHPFPDHHPFLPDDLRFDDDLPVLMTEKDAVKCRAFAARNRWFVPARAVLPEAFPDAVLRRLPR